MNWIALSVVAAGAMQASAIHHQTSAFILESHEKEIRNFIYSNNYLKVKSGYIDKGLTYEHCYLTCTGNKTGGVYDICVDPLTFAISLDSGYLLLVGALPLLENEIYPDQIIYDTDNFEQARLQYLDQSVFIVNEIISSQHRIVCGHPVNDSTISYTCVLSREEYDQAKECGYVYREKVNWAELSPIIQSDNQALLQSTRDYKIVNYNFLTEGYYQITVCYLDDNETFSGICDSDFYHQHNKDTYYDATYKRFVDLKDKEFNITQLPPKKELALRLSMLFSIILILSTLGLYFISPLWLFLLMPGVGGLLLTGLIDSSLQHNNLERISRGLSPNIAKELRRKHHF